MGSKSKGLVVPLGVSSMIVVFLVLCLSVFAMLSLSGAKGDLSLSEKDAEYTSAYYAASSRAALILDAVDAHLASGGDINQLDGASVEGISLSLSEGNIGCSVPLNGSQALQLLLAPKLSGESDYSYDILLWRVVSTGSWEYEGSISLMPIS